MNHEHPNVEILKQVDLTDRVGWSQIFHPDVIWHFYNDQELHLAGDYEGHDGIAEFLTKLRTLSEGTFAVDPKEAVAIGDELVVAQTCNRLAYAGKMVEFDVVTVWRIIDDLIVEVWDIPAVNTIRAACPV